MQLLEGNHKSEKDYISELEDMKLKLLGKENKYAL